jgi:(1->4)-alpha-D-glucan 1-alpha-D-glucosylmutase
MSSQLKTPRATYRLQFHRDFTLRDAQALVPYLDALGISHVYASPLLTARKGSPHGYDGCDPTRLNPELGTEADLESLVRALHERGMGLVLDIVPNHLAASPENPWWWNVLQLGPASAYANYFDIEWHSPDPLLNGKVLLPVLGDELERVLERNELKVVCEGDEVVVRYYDHRFPVSPGSLVVPEKRRLKRWLPSTPAATRWRSF